MRQARRWRDSGVTRGVSTANVICAATTCDTQSASQCVESTAFALNVGAPVHELLPGFVHMQGVLPVEAQQALLDMSCLVAAGSRQVGVSGGWYRRAENGKWDLNDGTKARFWDDIGRFPVSVKELGESLAKFAGRQFPSHLASCASSFQARVGALNYYTARGRMGWHVDDTNFAKAERPIVMANLGDAADFGYKMRKGDSDRSVRLESGDVVVFGGPSRNMAHALLQVYSGTSPEALNFPDPPGVMLARRTVSPSTPMKD